MLNRSVSHKRDAPSRCLSGGTLHQCEVVTSWGGDREPVHEFRERFSARIICRFRHPGRSVNHAGFFHQTSIKFGRGLSHGIKMLALNNSQEKWAANLALRRVYNLPKERSDSDCPLQTRWHWLSSKDGWKCQIKSPSYCGRRKSMSDPYCAWRE